MNIRLRKLKVSDGIALVVLLALATWLSFRALEVLEYKDYHVHGYIGLAPDNRYAMAWDQTTPSPFWPRYMRHLAYQSWNSQPVCGPGAGHPAETCEFVHPEIIVHARGRFAGFKPTPEMITMLGRMRQGEGLPPR